MKAVSDLFPYLLPFVPGCADPVAAQALVNAAIEFCEDSLAVRATLDSFTTTEGIFEYSLDAPNQQRVTRVLSVKLDGKNINPATQDLPNTDDLPNGRPTHYSVIHDEAAPQLVLLRTPDATPYVVSPYVAVCPTSSATLFNESLIQLYREALVQGALGQLHLIPNQSYTDAAASLTARGRFRYLIARARIDAFKGRVVTSVRANPRKLA